MNAQLEKIRRQKYIGVAELAHQAARILAEIGPAQGRGTVSFMPDERTIRYYLSEGLVSPAGDKQGAASVFGYVHLLQLLAVKQLQSEHFPIRKIKELVSGRTERELERLIGLDGKTSAKNQALDYLEQRLTKSASPASPQHLRNQQQQQSGPMMSPATLDSTAAARDSAPAAHPATWERVEIEPGLEVHLRGDYAPPADAKELRRLTRLILNAVEAHRAPPKKIAKK